jgi:thiol-disulfide isomerase/thioredoxin
MKRIILILSIVSIYINNATAQQLHFKEGEEFTVKTNNTETIPFNKKEAYTISFKVLAIDNGVYRLQCNLKQVKMDIKIGSTIYSLNSNSIRRTEFNNTNWALPLILLQKQFTVYVSAQGRIVKLEGYDDLVERAINDWHLNTSWILSKVKDFPYTILRNIFVELPGRAMVKGSTWAIDSTNYKVTGKQGNLISVKASNSSSNFDAAYVLNAATAMPLKANIAQFDNKGKLITSATYTQFIQKGQFSTPPADTAWINMAMRMSFMSDIFSNVKKDADSAKVFGYLAAHNKTYKNDPYYNRNRLSLIQHVRNQTAGLVYDSLLRITPNHFLAGSVSALFNKSYRALQEDPDSAYNVIRYFYKDKLFDDWLHNTLAQNFITTIEEDEKEIRINLLRRGMDESAIAKNISNNRRIKANSFILLEKLHADKSALMQQKVNALYLWVSARKQKANTGLLPTTAAQFNKLDDANMKSGYGGRYGLLLFNIFKDAGQQKIANTLLEKVIADMTRFQADTLYSDRFAARNLLAHAFHLSYRNTTDSVKALQYLAKAAKYSPASAKEKVNVSFYDREFLRSKESYTDEYLAKLFEHGDGENALQLLSQHVSADLEQLPQVQAMFEKRFPGKSFKSFFADKVLSSLPDAPQFILKGIDNTDHQLAQYKGKWLLTDFWGTWCVPCREEMPEINKFNTEINEGKHKGITFLSIACKDDIISVKKYLKENNFGIPVVMGTDALTNNYKIEGYPSKVLISPNGKMINIGFGSEWQKIVTKISELYPAPQ